MALEFPRNGTAKCPPLLIGGLIVMCFFLLCNWWSLSSQNLELLKQIDNLAEQLRVNGEELGKCSQQQVLLNEKLKDSQSRFVQQQIKIEEIKETENDVREGYEKLNEELTEAKLKCESLKKALETCTTEKLSLERIGLTQKLKIESQQSEIKHLQEEVRKKHEMLQFAEEKVGFGHKNGSVIKKGVSVPSIIEMMQDKVKKNKTQHEKDQEKGPEIDEGKNYGPDSSPFPLENDDPREEEMNIKLTDTNQ